MHLWAVSVLLHCHSVRVKSLSSLSWQQEGTGCPEGSAVASAAPACQMSARRAEMTTGLQLEAAGTGQRVLG